ncbi:MAG TPA: heavy metal-binding domain-containing protein [Geobacteraceae bacterium]|nr:heavy metal-binding domain-containing protein [Geobacteraceae bacterium]
MDIMQIIVTIGGVALIGVTLWFFFGRRPETRVKGMAEPYSCPMHPWITSSYPGAECSICGMKLVRQADSKGH